jgi:uroporphyrinogen decarboxylase
MIDPAGTVNKDFLPAGKEGEDRHFAGKDARVWAYEQEGVIREERDLEALSWPDPRTLDYGPFDEAAARLGPSMKVIAVLGKIFTAAWELVGFTRFCELVCTQPKLIDALIERIGTIQLGVFERLVRREEVGGFWIPDDIAFRSGTLLAPGWFGERIFPYYRRMAERCRELDKPIIYHSDGDLSSVIDTILETGFHALHPIEPESMDIYALRGKVGKRLCLVGNICVNTLSIGTPGEVRDLVKDRIERLGYQGAYCVGSSNSVPNYVQPDNYAAMLEASAEFGRCPED